jgi:hypothetical protein
MAKRYHQSKKDRKHESRGEKLHHARMHRDSMHERMGEESYVEHHRDMHNDSDRERYGMGPYRYDRQSQYRAMGGAEHYAGMEPRRHQEMRDAGMIHEDHRAIANLPQNVVYRDYPKNTGYLPEDLDDTLRGVDRQMAHDNYDMMNHFYPKKV